MKLLLSIKNFEDLNFQADEFVLGYEKYCSFAAGYFSYSEIKQTSLSHKVWVLMNALINEDEIENAKQELDRLMELGVGFIIQDIGLLSYLVNHYDLSKIIFNPYTLICNTEDLKAYQGLGVTVFVSNVATNIETLLSHKTVLQVYGYLPIYQSYRKVLSLYEKGHDVRLPSHDLFLKENTRDELYHSLENEYGTVVFNHELIDEIDEKNTKAKYWFIDSLYLRKEEIKNALERARLCRK